MFNSVQYGFAFTSSMVGNQCKISWNDKMAVTVFEYKGIRFIVLYPPKCSHDLYICISVPARCVNAQWTSDIISNTSLMSCSLVIVEAASALNASNPFVIASSYKFYLRDMLYIPPLLVMEHTM